jgi:hypothetical protein
MGMLRGGPGSSQSELPCITTPLWLRTVTHRPVGPTDCLRVFFLLINTIFLVLLIWFNFKSKFERLGYQILQCLVWTVIFETWIYYVILYYYIYPAYLGSWYCPKDFLLWPLVGTEKVKMRSASLSGYSVCSNLFIFYFDTFTECGPLALGRYSVGSYLISIC